MRALAMLTALAIIFALPSHARADEVRNPADVNKILPYGTFDTPDLAPGDQGILAFNLSNPYNLSMSNVALSVNIYEYVEQEVARSVDSSWSSQYPRFAEASSPGRNYTFSFPSLAPKSSSRLSLTVLTSTDMPHGGVFSQGAYLVRFWLTFTYNATPARMASPGYWSKAQFLYATEEGDRCTSTDCIGQVNLSRLGGISGILPDTAFGSKDTVPEWPFYLMAVGVAFFLVLAFLFYAEENPSTFPRAARSFAYVKGRLVRVFRPRRGRKRRDT